MITLKPGEEVLKKITADRWNSPGYVRCQITGKLILTNQRVIFLSHVHDFSIPYEEITNMKKSIIVFFPMGIVLETEQGFYEVAAVPRKPVMELIQSKMRECGKIEHYL